MQIDGYSVSRSEYDDLYRATTAYTYDLAGNLLSDGQSSTYTYNALGARNRQRIDTILQFVQNDEIL